MKTNRLNAVKGFTMVELLISMVIFLMAIALAGQLMRLGLTQKNTINTRVDSLKGARIALSYIRRDMINAGLSYHNIGGLVPDNFANKIIKSPADADTEQDFLTGIIAGDNVSTNILNTSGRMDSIGVVTRDLTFNSGKILNFTSTATSGSNVLVKTAAGDTANCRAFDMYLFATGTTQVVGMATSVDNSTNTLTLAVAPTDPIGVNLAADGVGNAKNLLVGTNITGSLKKILLTTYTVDNSGNLVRTTYGNMTGQAASAQIDSRTLITDVLDFQVSYLLDDGTITSDPSKGNNGRGNQILMNKVVQIEVTLTVNDTTSNTASPITLKEVISTRNLRYTIG